MTLAERLRALYPEASGRSLKQWLETGRVTVDGRACRDGRLEIGPDAVVADIRKAFHDDSSLSRSRGEPRK